MLVQILATLGLLFALASWSVPGAAAAITINSIDDSGQTISGKDLGGGPITLGYVGQEIKVKGQIRSSGATFFSIENPLLKTVRLNLGRRSIPLHTRYPFPTFEIPHNYQGSFSLAISSDASIKINLKLKNSDNYHQERLVISVFYAVYIAAIAIFLVLLLFLYRATKKPMTLNYFLVVFLLHGWVPMALFGLPVNLLNDSWSYLGTIMIVCSQGGSAIAVILFVESIMGEKIPWRRTLISASAILAILSFFVQSIYVMLGILLTCLLSISVITLSFVKNRNKNSHFNHYMYALLSVFFGVSIFVVDYIGLMEIPFANYSLFVGAIGEFSVISWIITNIMLEEKSRLAFYHSSLGGLISQSKIEGLISMKQDLDLTPKEVEISVMFVDIVGFSTLSSKIDSHSNLEAQLKSFFKNIKEIILDYGGETNKTLGDGVLAYFGHSITGEVSHNHREESINCALAIQRASVHWITSKKLSNPMVMRIGLDAGRVRVGNVGSDRLDYNLTGQTVINAQRMEASCDPFKVLVSSDMFSKLDSQSAYSSNTKFIKIKHKKGLQKSFLIDPFAGFEEYDFNSARQKYREFYDHSKRSNTRWTLTEELFFQIETPVQLQCRLVDLSENGISFQANCDIGRGVLLTGTVDDCHFGCFVRWSEKRDQDTFHVGAQFIEINKTEIDKMVSTYCKETDQGITHIGA